MRATRFCLTVAAIVVPCARGASPAESTTRDAETAALAKEVRGKGWIVFGARGERKDWDLFLMRPDGSDLRNITNTPEYAEAAPRFSPDARRLLYRRLPKRSMISHDVWGFQGQLVIANADGSEPTVFGKKGEFPWASWGPEGKRIACLTRKDIQIVDLATRKVVRRLKRKGFFQQLFWSPDGKWFCGVANHLGKGWTIARMNLASGEVNGIITQSACTPDWQPDSQGLIFSYNPDFGGPRGWTRLMVASGDGGNHRLVYGQDRRHVYGGRVSPDGKYVLFSVSVIDGGLSEWSGAPLGLMRLADTPAIGGKSPLLRERFPETKDGPVLKLPVGWEPDWTHAPLGAAGAGTAAAGTRTGEGQ